MKRLTLFALALLTSLAVSAQEIALQLYSLRNELADNPGEYFEMIPTWGINALEGGGGYGYTEEEFDQMLADHDMRIIGVGADYNQLSEDLSPIIANAKRFGAKYATCYWIPHPDGPISEEELTAATDLFNEAGAKLAQEGITLLYHPHGYEFTETEDGFLIDYMFENARNFKFNMDVYWVQQGGGDPLKYMKDYPGMFPVLHMKDRQKGTADTKNGHADVETNVVLGTGDLDIKGIIKEAKKQGTEYLVIEDESSRSVAQIPQSVKFIQKHLK
ncbi:sugar phosphate isomerase/epimerase family protein [Algoriphagus sediminis]|uniref:Sugar phosphate isomerase/epimerase n=1 Tax=Algoriphagus sediminis TaxID=3057113 RepID=A0ABT7Y9X6_9BACT|nr:sugar phosphate isomerase/epimerase [Algoriphagus sediminis]MDN3203009.1 sugar phosphate isomerase/epimerase [Algoriphagus sediminis]